MKFYTEAKVYLIGQQSIVEDSLQEFLNDNETPDWKTDTDVAGQKLVELNGRLCYNSYKTPRPGGNSAYIEHILEVGHGCYDGETEVLTKRGWKKWKDVDGKTEEFATRNKDGVIEYHHAVATNLGVPYSGKMYKVTSKSVDLLVTPNHNLFVCLSNSKDGRKKENFQLIRADEVNGKSHYHVKDGIYKSDQDNYSYDELALIGFAIGDGSKTGRMRNTMEFHLRRKRKIEYLYKLCGRLGLKIQCDRDEFFTVEWRFGHDFSIYDDKDKVIPEGLIFEKNAAGLFEGLMNSDGTYVGLTAYDTSSKKLADQFQQLCFHLGYATNISQAECYKYSQHTEKKGRFGNKDNYRIYVLSQQYNKPHINKFSGAKSKSSWVEDWSGPVYCVQVPNNTLYVRRNGKPVWCGNSVIEGCFFNFIFTQVSRSFTHELIRHRAGTSFSQLSQRFVDESDCDFVVPPALRKSKLAYDHYVENHDDNPGLDAQPYMNWVSHMTNSVKQYKYLSDHLYKEYKDIPDKTLRRKRAREAARSVLPNATETKIAVGFNARAARHFIEMRGDIHADQEIREVALKFAVICKDAAPNLFPDYEITEDGQLTYKYRKV